LPSINGVYLVRKSETDVHCYKRWDIGMVYGAIALAMVGIAVGLVFRLKILLSILALLLLVSIMFSVGSGFGFLETALTIMVGQTILQASYFLGLVIRAVFSSTHHMRPVL